MLRFSSDPVTTNERLTFIFRGGKTKRYHTEDTMTEQTVADHSFGVAMLVELMAPECRKELILAALTHDLAEHLVGDISAPVKRANPEIKLVLDHMESTRLNRVGFNYEEKLTKEEHYILKAADYIDGMMFCVRERRMGSRAVDHIYKNFESYVLKVLNHLPPEAELVFNAARNLWREACQA